MIVTNLVCNKDFFPSFRNCKIIMCKGLFLNSDSFIITYHISLVSIQTNYCNNNLLILDAKQLNKIIKLYYLKAPWDGQGEIKMYYGMSRVKKQLSGKTSIIKKYVPKKVYLRIPSWGKQQV